MRQSMSYYNFYEIEFSETQKEDENTEYFAIFAMLMVATVNNI